MILSWYIQTELAEPTGVWQPTDALRRGIHVDMLAEEIGMDPAEIRMVNAIENGDMQVEVTAVVFASASRRLPRHPTGRKGARFQGKISTRY
jgi:CO/xanthine dehydrogenase Mo-binding subunit